MSENYELRYTGSSYAGELKFSTKKFEKLEVDFENFSPK
jgi:hypothetical protein